MASTVHVRRFDAPDDSLDMKDAGRIAIIQSNAETRITAAISSKYLPVTMATSTGRKLLNSSSSRPLNTATDNRTGQAASAAISQALTARKMRRAAPPVGEPPFAWSAAGSAAHEAFIGDLD